MRRLDAVVLLLTGAVVAVAVVPAGRWPTGDAPHFLGIAAYLVNELKASQLDQWAFHLSSLLAPHPPGGYLFTFPALLAGLDQHVALTTGLLALALTWHGLRLLAVDDGPPLGAWLLLLGTPLTWLAVEGLWWDLLAAACAAATLGHLHASRGLTRRGHTLAFGAFMGLGFLTKYTFPFFVVVPTLVAGLGLVRAGTKGWVGLGASLVAFGVVALPWYGVKWDRVLAYAADSNDPGSTMVDATSQPLTTAELLQPEQLAYYPSVLVEGLGWPGFLLLVAALPALRRPGPRLAVLGALGGLLILSLMGQRQPRYLLPALPLLFLGVEAGLQPALRGVRAVGAVLLVGVALPGLWGAASTSFVTTSAPATRLASHGPDALSGWGSWPWPAEAFKPVSGNPDVWKIDEALLALADVAGATPQTIGVLLEETPSSPGTGTYIWRAASLGLPWDVATVKPRGRGGQPQVFIGPFAGEGWPPRDFDALYVVDGPTREGSAFASRLGATAGWSHELPDGRTGTVFSVPDSAWERSPGRDLLREDGPTGP